MAGPIIAGSGKTWIQALLFLVIVFVGCLFLMPPEMRHRFAQDFPWFGSAVNWVLHALGKPGI